MKRKIYNNKKVTKKQMRVFKVTQEFIKEHGYSPTIREITEIVGLKSSSTIFEQLKQLEDKGYIDIEPFKSRGISIIGGEDE